MAATKRAVKKATKKISVKAPVKNKTKVKLCGKEYVSAIMCEHEVDGVTFQVNLSSIEVELDEFGTRATRVTVDYLDYNGGAKVTCKHNITPQTKDFIVKTVVNPIADTLENLVAGGDAASLENYIFTQIRDVENISDIGTNLEITITRNGDIRYKLVDLEVRTYTAVEVEATTELQFQESLFTDVSGFITYDEPTICSRKLKL